VKLSDNGRPTVLDDPQLRELTGRYGDPDVLLPGDWMEAVPGITYPVDYMRDCDSDPYSWVCRELEGRLPSTVGVPRL
jgi:hypothetical protein